ncbi:MAG: DUF2357 domain-containing protein [Gemmatimonadetes bacterium]|nr:DUF2357 domain-containing protein [Gemmatimonadota bacterium]
MQFGESEVQLLEGERYEYEVVDATRSGLRLRSSLNPRRTKLRSSTAPDAGFIETGDYCGTLLLTLSSADSVEPLGSVCIDVRSIKLDYRSEYRGMLEALSETIASLVLDARSSVKTSLRSNLEESAGPGWLQIQLEFLRDVLEGNDFGHALERIALYTHEQLTRRTDVRAAGAPGRWTARSIRQLSGPGPRRTLPASHPMRVRGDIVSVPETVEISAKVANIDTPENRFVKFVLTEWRELLVRAQSALSRSSQWKSAEVLANRLSDTVDRALRSGIFREIGDLRVAPLGSPVLQRRAGYREVLRWWLKLHAAAEVSWDGGEELFRAGERRVATLYEYWLFFQLLDWYCTHCRDGARPALEELLDGLEDGAIQLRLKRGSQLGPFEGLSSAMADVFDRGSPTTRDSPSPTTAGEAGPGRAP